MTISSIIQTYPTISDLLGNYPVSSIPVYASDEERCVLGASPRIMDVVAAYKASRELESWIGRIIRYICKASDITKNVDIQIGMTVQLIMTRYKTMKMSELMLFAAKFIIGDYEKFYGSYDIQSITRSLTNFISYRNNIISKYDTKISNTKSGEKIDGKQSYKIYLDNLQKAMYGDRDAYTYLRLESDLDLAKCIAWCVRRGDFPRSALDYINGEYFDVVMPILERQLLRQA